MEAELLAVAVSSWEGGERDEIRYFLLFVLGIYNLGFFSFISMYILKWS